MVLVKARIFRRHYGVLEIGRDLGERNEMVALLVGAILEPRLKLPLALYRGRGWIDPSRQQEQERGCEPEAQKNKANPSREQLQ